MQVTLEVTQTEDHHDDYVNDYGDLTTGESLSITYYQALPSITCLLVPFVKYLFIVSITVKFLNFFLFADLMLMVVSPRDCQSSDCQVHFDVIKLTNFNRENGSDLCQMNQ